MKQNRKLEDEVHAGGGERRAPQQQRALDRIEAILAATEEAITEGGYDNLRVVDIAERAGITHTSIYQYFPSIEEILKTLIGRYMGDFQMRMDALVAAAETPQALIAALIESLFIAFDIYRSKPAARGLWITSRYLATLRKMDEEDCIRVARLFRARLIELAPRLDADAGYIAALTAASLTIPACQLALSVSPRQQMKVLNNFAEMVRLRFTAIIRP